jgi:hypothetical protein
VRATTTEEYNAHLRARQTYPPIDEKLAAQGWRISAPPAIELGDWTLRNDEADLERTMWSRARPFSVGTPGEVVRITKEGSLVAVDLASGKERLLASLGVSNVVRTGALSPDRRFILLEVPNERALYDTATWKEIRRWPRSTWPIWISGPGGTYLAVRLNPFKPSLTYEPLHLLDPATGRKVVLPLTVQNISGRGVIPLADGRFVVGLSDGTVVLLDGDGKVARTLFPAAH